MRYCAPEIIPDGEYVISYQVMYGIQGQVQVIGTVIFANQQAIAFCI